MVRRELLEVGLSLLPWLPRLHSVAKVSSVRVKVCLTIRVCFLTRHLLRGQLRGLKVSGITRAVLWQSCVLTLSISLVGMMSALTNPICLPLCCLLQLSSPFLLDPELGIGIFQ